MNRKKVAESLVKLAKELMAVPFDEAFKSKMDLDRVRRDLEHSSVRALDAVMGLSPKAKLVDESVLTFSEGTSHKFHFFALYNDGGTWKAGNAYGRIGANPKAIMFASGAEWSVKGDYNDKIRNKKAKGYREA